MSEGALPVRFGMFLSQADHSWSQMVDWVLMAEELGYDHAWIVDHLLDTDGPPSNPCHEAWTLLAGLGALTSRIRLGILVSSNTFRNPAILVKQAVTVDHVTAGRVILGIGTGWHEDEHRRFGIDLPPPPERVDRFEEAVTIIDLLMRQERTSFAGRHYRLDDAPLEPRPVQEPRIPLLIAAHRPRMLRIAARFADQWDTFATMPGTATDGVSDDIAERVATLDAACVAIGRDPASLRRSTWTTGDALASEEAFETYVRRFHPLGFTDFSTVRPAESDIPTWKRIAREVIPRLREELATG